MTNTRLTKCNVTLTCYNALFVCNIAQIDSLTKCDKALSRTNDTMALTGQQSHFLWP